MDENEVKDLLGISESEQSRVFRGLKKLSMVFLGSSSSGEGLADGRS